MSSGVRSIDFAGYSIKPLLSVHRTREKYYLKIHYAFQNHKYKLSELFQPYCKPCLIPD